MYLEDIITIKVKKLIVVKHLTIIGTYVNIDQIYLYKRMVKWLPVRDHCFIIPIKNNEHLVTRSRTKK